MSEDNSGHHDTSTSSGTSEATAGSYDQWRPVQSVLIKVFEEAYSLLGVTVSRCSQVDGSAFGAMFEAPEGEGGVERGLLLGMDFRPIPQDGWSTVQGHGSGASTGENVRPRMVGWFGEVSAEDEYLNDPKLLEAGGDISEIRQERAYYHTLKHGLENAGIKASISADPNTPGVQFQSVDDTVTPAMEELLRGLGYESDEGEPSETMISEDTTGISTLGDNGSEDGGQDE